MKVNIKHEKKHGTNYRRKSNSKRVIWPCRFCHITFKSRYLRSKHEIIHGKEGSWSCEICDATFETKALFAKHHNIHRTRIIHKDKKSESEWNCKICDKQCKKKRLYYSHLVHKHPESAELVDLDLNLILKFVCHICGKRFSSNSNLRDHELIHKGKTVPCPVCDRLFITTHQMRRHMKTHANGKRPSTTKFNKPKSVCSYCGRVFSFAKNCKAHELTHKPKSQRPWQCEYEGCSAGFTLKSSLINHYNTHTGKREYCPYCEKGFSQKSALRTHIKTLHAQYKPYKCSYEGCNAAFSLKVSLKEHTVEHTGQFPFNCQWCQKGFKQKGNLKNHMQKRHGQSDTEYHQ